MVISIWRLAVGINQWVNKAITTGSLDKRFWVGLVQVGYVCLSASALMWPPLV
jgi:hypothetical protein